jgi:hypothetical protein
MNDIVPRKSAVPQIVDEDGNPLEGPEMEKVSSLVMQMAQLAQLARIRKAAEIDIIKGLPVEKILNCTDSPQYLNLLIEDPYNALATASFQNLGPNTAFIIINQVAYPKQLPAGQTWEVDFSKAKRRIDVISYYCNTGETATVLADGKY